MHFLLLHSPCHRCSPIQRLYYRTCSGPFHPSNTYPSSNRSASTECREWLSLYQTSSSGSSGPTPQKRTLDPRALDLPPVSVSGNKTIVRFPAFAPTPHSRRRSTHSEDASVLVQLPFLLQFLFLSLFFSRSYHSLSLAPGDHSIAPSAPLFLKRPFQSLRFSFVSRSISL